MSFPTLPTPVPVLVCGWTLLGAKYEQTVVRVVVVQKVLRAENNIKVRHVDYGDTQEVNINDFFSLDRKLLS